MKLLDRISDGLDGLLGKNAFAPINPLGLQPSDAELKEAMRFPAQGGNAMPFARDYSFNWTSSGIVADYRKLVGEMDLSSLVMVCVNWFGTTLPEAPIQVLEFEKGKGLKDGQDVPEHPLVEALEWPNDHYDIDIFWKAFCRDWFIDGNVYWRKVRNDDRTKVLELWPVPAYMMEPRWSKDDPTQFITHYDYIVDSKAYPVFTEDVVHFRHGVDWSAPSYGRKGISPLRSGLREIYGDLKASELAAGLMKRWGVVSHIITPKDSAVSMTPTEGAAYKQQFINETTGDNAGNPMFVGAQLEVTRMGANPKELDLSELRMLPEERVPALLQIPPIVLGLIVGLRNSTYSNFEQARQMAYEQMIIPTQKSIARTITHKLLPDYQTSKKKERAVFDLSQVRVLQEDEDKLHTRARENAKAQIWTLNEARQATGKPEDPDGDRYLEAKPAAAGAPDPNAPTQEEIDQALAEMEKMIR